MVKIKKEPDTREKRTKKIKQKMETTLLILALVGIIGALCKDIIQDNKIKLPKKDGEDIVLGSLGGMIIGGITAYLIDGNPTTAFMAGYTGTSIIENLIKTNGTMATQPNNLIEAIIRKIATEEGVSPDLAVKVAKCESNLDPKAININTDGSRDRGIYQINDKWHPEVTDEQAFNVEWSTRFFCKAFKNGNLSWWDASKSCWG